MIWTNDIADVTEARRDSYDDHPGRYGVIEESSNMQLDHKVRGEAVMSVGLNSFSHLFFPFLSIFLKKIFSFVQCHVSFRGTCTHTSILLRVLISEIHVSGLRRYAIKRACVINPTKGRDKDSGWNDPWIWNQTCESGRH